MRLIFKSLNIPFLKYNLIATTILLMVTFIIVRCINFNEISDNSEDNLVDEVHNYNDVLQIADTKKENTYFTKKIVIKKGDTLSKIFAKQKLHNQDIKNLTHLAQKAKITANLPIGNDILFEYMSDEGNQNDVLQKLTITIDKFNLIQFIRNGDQFTFEKVVVQLNKFIAKYEADIDSSFIETLKSMTLSNKTISQLISAYSNKINFQRSIKQGDKITLIIEKFVTKSGECAYTGNVLYASLKTNKKTHNIYYYASSKENYKFFDDNGHSIRSNFFGNPLKTIRVSSSYGYRKHPILGCRKMHKGVDFAAAKNTPIYATADGIVTFVGYKGGYGNVVKIKHNRQLATLYAHATKFAKNLRNGSSVKQGDVIAYVGSTGRATAPHLHYEVHVNGKQVNPMQFKPASDVVLAKDKLKQFKKFKLELESLKLNLDNDDIVVSDSGIYKFL